MGKKRLRITKKTAKKLIRDLAKEYGVRLHFNYTELKHYGAARFWNNSISINVNQSGLNMISTFFHEIGHIYCWNNGIWKAYHTGKDIDDLTISEKQAFIRTALKAERWVDMWGKKEMKKHFPHLKYQDSYITKLDGEHFKKEIRKLIRYDK